MIFVALGSVRGMKLQLGPQRWAGAGSRRVTGRTGQLPRAAPQHSPLLLQYRLLWRLLEK